MQESHSRKKIGFFRKSSNGRHFPTWEMPRLQRESTHGMVAVKTADANIENSPVIELMSRRIAFGWQSQQLFLMRF